MIRLLHAPKTGGTALAWALRGTDVKRSGHSVRLADLPPDVRVVTIVRDPVDRFISTLGWLERTYQKHYTPERLLALPRLVLSSDLDLLAPQSWWLGPPERLQAMALWIGRTETLDEDFLRLRDLLGLDDSHRLPPRGHQNRNEGPPPVPLHPDTAAAVRERYAVDYALTQETTAMPKHPKTVLVVPSPNLHFTAAVRGVPARGREMSLDEAQPLLDAGLVVIKEPEEKPVTNKKESD